MTELIACLSTGKGTWGHVGRLIQEENWDNIFLITNDFGKEKFTSEKKTELIVVDSNKPLIDLKKDIHKALKDKIKGTEVAINIISGSGKEHMALIAAVLNLGVGMRLIALTKDGIKEIR